MRFQIAGTALAGCLAVTMSGCAVQPFETSASDTPVVPVESVINALKCGFAKALVADTADISGLSGSTAAIVLKVNVVAGHTLGGNASISGIPVFKGASITPSFGGKYTDTRTINSEVDFQIDLAAKDTSICVGHEADAGRDAGFSDWIGGLVVGINNAAKGPPLASLQKYVYDSDFTVNADANASLGFTMVPVTLNINADQSRQDVQHITVTVVATHKGPDGKSAPNGPEFDLPLRVTPRG